MDAKIKNALLSTFIVLFVIQLSIAQKKVQQRQNSMNTSFNVFSKFPSVNSGFWFATVEGDDICIQFMDSNTRKQPSFIISNCFPRKEFRGLESSENFEFVREAGAINFKGRLFGIKGTGEFTFNKNNDFEDFLRKEGISTEDTNDYYYFKLFLGNVSKDYVLGLKKEGYKPTAKQLGKLGIHNVSLAYIKDLSRIGYKGLELNMLAKFAIHNITIDYINNLAKVGYGNLEANMLKKFAIHSISIDYIKSLSELGYGSLAPDMLKRFAIHNISPDYIKSLAKVGYGNLDPNTLKKFAIHNISSNYITSLNKTKIDKPDASTIRKAKIHNVTANFIQQAQNKGYDSRDLSDYIRLKIHGI